MQWPESIEHSVALVAAWIAFLQLFKRIVGTGYCYAFLSLTGTILHELCHFIMGLALAAKPVGLSLWPKKIGQRWVLGSVDFQGLGLWNAAPVAFAPLLLWGGSAWLIGSPMAAAYAQENFGQWIAMGYLCACCALAGRPSRVDIQAGWKSLAAYSCFALLAYFYLRG